MAKLIAWYKKDTETLPLIKAAVFVYDFLSIHPFQDGNGRVSRLLGTLLLLKHGYSWVQYVSFKHEIENRKSGLISVGRKKVGAIRGTPSGHNPNHPHVFLSPYHGPYN